jgi:hypothetical protein
MNVDYKLRRLSIALIVALQNLLFMPCMKKKLDLYGIAFFIDLVRIAKRENIYFVKRNCLNISETKRN